MDMYFNRLSGAFPKLVIFDMDGLILDTETISIDGWAKAGSELGFSIPLELFGSLFGCGKVECRKRMAAALGGSFDFDAAYAIRTEYVKSHIEKHGVNAKKGLDGLLCFLSEYSVYKCVATSTEREKAEYLLGKAGVFGRFDKIIGGGDVARGKPEPDIFIAAADAFDMKPDDCIVLEDSSTGSEAARRGGFRTILVPDLSRPDEATLSFVSAVCEDLNGAADAIKTLLK